MRPKKAAPRHDPGYKSLFSHPRMVGDRLPAVLPVVLHNAKSRWRAPLRLETLFVPIPKPLKRYLPRLTYLLLDERRLDLDRPELKRNPAAALFRFETNETLEALPGLYQTLNDVLPREDPGLRRTIQAWVTSVVRRRVPDAIIPEGVSFTEVSMFEETMIKWRDQVLREAAEKSREQRREGRREGKAQGMQALILQLMTQRFGRLPARVRRQVEAISSIQELHTGVEPELEYGSATKRCSLASYGGPKTEASRGSTSQDRTGAACRG